MTIRALFCALLLLLCAAQAGAQVTAQSQEFPDFKLQKNTGGKWQLAKYDGRPKLLMFWATWCPYCRRLFPEIQALHEQYGSKGLKVLALSIRDDGDTVAYAKKQGLTFDIVELADPVAVEVGVKGTPTVVLLDGDNQVRFVTSVSDPGDPRLRNKVVSLMQAHKAGSR